MPHLILKQINEDRLKVERQLLALDREIYCYNKIKFYKTIIKMSWAELDRHQGTMVMNNNNSNNKQFKAQQASRMAKLPKLTQTKIIIINIKEGPQLNPNHKIDYCQFLQIH